MYPFLLVFLSIVRFCPCDLSDRTLIAADGVDWCPSLCVVTKSISAAFDQINLIDCIRLEFRPDHVTLNRKKRRNLIKLQRRRRVLKSISVSIVRPGRTVVTLPLSSESPRPAFQWNFFSATIQRKLQLLKFHSAIPSFGFVLHVYDAYSARDNLVMLLLLYTCCLIDQQSIYY